MQLTRFPPLDCCTTLLRVSTDDTARAAASDDHGTKVADAGFSGVVSPKARGGRVRQRAGHSGFVFLSVVHCCSSHLVLFFYVAFYVRIVGRRDWLAEVLGLYSVWKNDGF